MLSLAQVNLRHILTKQSIDFPLWVSDSFACPEFIYYLLTLGHLFHYIFSFNNKSSLTEDQLNQFFTHLSMYKIMEIAKNFIWMRNLYT